MGKQAQASLLCVLCTLLGAGGRLCTVCALTFSAARAFSLPPLPTLFKNIHVSPLLFLSLTP